jgi:hypothetical protein
VRAQVTALAQLAHIQALTGDTAAASGTLENVLGTSVAKADPAIGAVVSAMKAWLDAQNGGHADVRRFLDDVPRLLETLEDPAEEATVLTFAGQAALAVGHHEEALALAQLLRNVAESASLAYALAPTNLLFAAVLAERDPLLAADPLERALAKAIEQRTKPWEIEARTKLGALHAGTITAAEHLTRAMEALQAITRDLPDETATSVLSSRWATELRTAFTAERARVANNSRRILLTT